MRNSSHNSCYTSDGKLPTKGEKTVRDPDPDPDTDTYTGYLRPIEASFCMNECGQYSLESESGKYMTNVTYQDNMESLAYFKDRYVTITGEEISCVECDAVDVETIELKADCMNPFSCFVDPCLDAGCTAYPDAECVANYCGGCHADFYDPTGTLVDCESSDCDPDLVCGQAETCVDGLLYPTTCGPDNCDTSNSVCGDYYDLAGIDFGLCTMVLGTAVVEGECQILSGCGWVVGDVDYSNVFFDSMDQCQGAACNYSSTAYENLHTGEYATCEFDNDCIAVWGDCDVGLGGCHYSVNAENYPENEINNLVDLWSNNGCTAGVCDCAPPPYAQCIENTCTSAYCIDEPNPAGCIQTGCDEGYECMVTNDCTPSTCFCDSSGFNGGWSCTDDCGGGSCVEISQTCDVIETTYEELLNNDLNTTCSTDNDCVAVWGDCGVGLGGCHYAANAENYPENEINDLVAQWIEGDCTEWVCGCLGLPQATCNNGSCELSYCEEPNPAGCFQTGCDEGYECMVTTNDCTPSSCFCDSDGLDGDWICTEDCGGGSCYISELGDINLDELVNIQDIIVLVNFIVATDEPNEYQYDAADINADNNLDILDIIGIVNLILSTCESCLANNGSWSIGQCFETECGSTQHPTDVSCWDGEPNSCPTPLEECLSNCAWVPENPVCANGTTYLNECEATCHGASAWEDGMCSNNGCILTDGTVVNDGWSGDGTGNNWCNNCFCDDGLLACTEMACVGCLINDTEYAEGEAIATTDPCEFCACSNGDMLCAVIDCLPPDPDCDTYITPPDECCPVCKDSYCVQNPADDMCTDLELFA